MLQRTDTESNLPGNAEHLIIRLESAGRTLMALPSSGHSTRLVQGGLEWIRDVSESYGRSAAKLRPATPSASEISDMDEALAWIPLIPADKYVLRRIVGSRCLINPMTDRQLFTWRRIGTAIGSDHKAVQRWHGQGIDLIMAALRRGVSSAARVAASGANGRAGLPQPPAHHSGANA